MITPALQSAHNTIDAAVSVDAEPAQQLIAAKCRALMVGYDRHWSLALWETRSVEEVFHVPIVNPATGATSRTFTLAGKFDGIIERFGEQLLLEHKTASEDISDPNSSYWRRLTVDSQVSAYLLANWQAERKLHGTVYDVVRKPSIRPKQLTKAEKREIAQTGTYSGSPLPEKYEQTDEETIELYERRLTADVLRRPDWYFQRRIVPRTDHELLEFAVELWDVAKSILSARHHSRHYRNDAACMLYGSPCQFLPLCSGHDSIDSGSWQTTDNVHPELPLLTDDGNRSVLTNTRLRCFKTCRRQHFLRYELGLRAYRDTESEALYFGRLWHIAQEAWWSCFMNNSAEGDHDDDLVDGTAAESFAAAREEGLVPVC